MSRRCDKSLHRPHMLYVGPSRKILTDNGIEFKNKLWTEVFEKLRIEQKFTPIYSPSAMAESKDSTNSSKPR